MAKEKRHYAVYFRELFYDEITNQETKLQWRLAGNTYAVSEAQAINNVRHRCFGNISQYKPVSEYGSSMIELEWKAEVTP